MTQGRPPPTDGRPVGASLYLSLSAALFGALCAHRQRRAGRAVGAPKGQLEPFGC